MTQNDDSSSGAEGLDPRAARGPTVQLHAAHRWRTRDGPDDAKRFVPVELAAKLVPSPGPDRGRAAATSTTTTAASAATSTTTATRARRRRASRARRPSRNGAPVGRAAPVPWRFVLAAEMVEAERKPVARASSTDDEAALRELPGSGAATRNARIGGRRTARRGARAASAPMAAPSAADAWAAFDGPHSRSRAAPSRAARRRRRTPWATAPRARPATPAAGRRGGRGAARPAARVAAAFAAGLSAPAPDDEVEIDPFGARGRRGCGRARRPARPAASGDDARRSAACRRVRLVRAGARAAMACDHEPWAHGCDGGRPRRRARCRTCSAATRSAPTARGRRRGRRRSTVQTSGAEGARHRAVRCGSGDRAGHGGRPAGRAPPSRMCGAWYGAVRVGARASPRVES